MKKHKVIYKLKSLEGASEEKIVAKREISYEIKLFTRLMLDEMCHNWNKDQIEKQINASIDAGDKERFLELSKLYQPFTWE